MDTDKLFENIGTTPIIVVAFITGMFNALVLYLKNRHAKQKIMLEDKVKDRDLDRLTTKQYIERAEERNRLLELEKEELEVKNKRMSKDIYKSNSDMREEVLIKELYIEQIAGLKEQLNVFEPMVDKMEYLFGREELAILVDKTSLEKQYELKKIISDFIERTYPNESKNNT